MIRDRSTGAALPGVLLIMFWLTGVTGWLVAHAIWDQRMRAIDMETAALGRVADAMTEVMARQVASVVDWSLLADPGLELGCPAAGPALPATISVATETATLQTATDAMSRWSAAMHPEWRFLAACDAVALQGEWRGRGQAPWLLAWAAATPYDVTAAAPTQLALQVVALQPGRGRATRLAVVRRFPGQTAARIIAWHPG